MEGVDGKSAREEERARHLAAVRRYWRETHHLYLEEVGTTWQAGHLITGSGHADPRESNLRLAAAAGIKPGYRVLDAGCGVCGPAADIAANIPGVQIAAVTISPEQALAGADLVRRAGLERVIHVAVADYHELPLAAASFDVVYYFESAGYSYEPRLLFGEAFRVLRPGGTAYVKDICRKPEPLSPDEARGLAQFNENYAYRTATIGDTTAAMAASGFTRIKARDITDRVSTIHVLEAMFRLEDGDLRPTRFGERHFRTYPGLPLLHAEISGVRPVNSLCPQSLADGNIRTN
jgi:ubiquinone/menaquinone biosynthesis C-methylase UbiE